MSRAVKGLLVKDIRLLKNQKAFFLIVIGMVAAFALIYQEPFLCVGYCTMMFAFFTLSTFTYDEYNNGNAYLLTLAVSRKDYVLEKYVFGFVISTTSWIGANIVICVVVYLINSHVNLTEQLVTGAVVLSLAWLLLGIEIPVQMKFGQDKSRIAIMIPIAVMVIILWCLGELTEVDLNTVIDRITRMDIKVTAALASGILAVVLFFSYKISLGIMEKRQF